MADPSALTLALVWFAGELYDEDGHMTGPRITPPSDGLWRFPLPAWRGYLPTRSQEYRAEDGKQKAHHGVDLMYLRRPGGPDQMWPSGVRGTGELRRSHGNHKFFFPDGITAHAARAGTLWHVGRGGKGAYVVIDHGKPFATFYTHLSSVMFPYLTRGTGAIKVEAGQPLGIVSHSPEDASKLMHLHFAIWYRGGSRAHVDPWPLLERAPLPEIKP